MTVTIRPYQHEKDYDRVGDFLIDVFQPDAIPQNWLQPRWEYMHYHPLIWETDCTKIGIAENDAGAIVGVVHQEHADSHLYFQVHPAYDHIQPLLLDYAEKVYTELARSRGAETLGLYIDESNATLNKLAAERGFTRQDTWFEETSDYRINGPIPETPIPPGYRIQSLADENDLRKVHQVLWRGFNHEGPPDSDEDNGRRFMQSAPNFRHDLTLVAVAPNGDYVSFSGIWYVPQNKVAYVEPVATDPDYRRMGLGRAVVMECVRRCAAEGATVAWVGSNQEFYLSMGFVPRYRTYMWTRPLG